MKDISDIKSDVMRRSVQIMTFPFFLTVSLFFGPIRGAWELVRDLIQTEIDVWKARP